MPPHILITGAAKRLGRSIAYRLAEDGWSLLLHYCESRDEVLRTQEECYQLALSKNEKNSSFSIIQGDFADNRGITDFTQKLDQWPIVGLVNNIGLFFTGPASDFSSTAAEKMFHFNFFLPCLLIQSIIPFLKKSEGSIINIGTAGLLRYSADTYAPFYHASKQSLLYLTKSFAKELAPYHISINMVSPGKLDISVDAKDTSHYIPYGRLGFPSEVAELVAFLFSSKNKYITGQNIEVSGGFCI